MKKDILQELYNGQISQEEARWEYRNVEDQVHDETLYETLADHFGLSTIESKVFVRLASPITLARWRYEGWPSECNVCNQKINLENFDWSAQERDKGGMGIVHFKCDFPWPEPGEDDEETIELGDPPYIKFVKWNSVTACIDSYSSAQWHLGSSHPRTGKVFLPAIRGKRMWASKRIDVLKELNEKTITLNQANGIYKQLMESKEAPNAGWRLGLNQIERIALIQGTPLKILLEWRYQGWPQACYRCGKHVEITVNHTWAIEQRKGKAFTLVHYMCFPWKKYSNRFFNRPIYVQPKPKFDILKDLHEGHIDCRQAYSIFHNVINDFHRGRITQEKFLDIYTYCGFSPQEAITEVHAMPLDVIMGWRYRGWPDKCLLCSKTVDSTNFDWFIRKQEDGSFGLIHGACWKLENDFNEKSE
jgi:hypothetical protein